MEQERQFPEATGELSNLLYDVCLAAKIISRNVRRAGLSDILGEMGTTNIQGEMQQNLDVFANDTIRNAVQPAGRTCVLASEEDEEPVPTPPGRPAGKYVLLFDPLDGSSNIDVNVSIGTIFSIHRRVTPDGGPGTLEDCLQPGHRQVAAGYILYGSSTMLVYTTGEGRPRLHARAVDRRIPAVASGVPNAGGRQVLQRERELLGPLVGDGAQDGGRLQDRVTHGATAKNARYIGSLVADFHRNLVTGGIFLYPADSKNPQGKLRLLYEAAPLALIAEQAGGLATDGHRPILDIVPETLHQRVPLVIGSRKRRGARHRASCRRSPSRT